MGSHCHSEGKHTSTKNDLASLLGAQGNLVNATDILDNIEDEAGVDEGMEEDHIANRAIGDGGTEDGNIVLETARGKREPNTFQHQ